MCLGKCFENGACYRTLLGDVKLSGDGLRLYHTTPQSNEARSFFKGDASWTQNSDGTFAVTESHNIEIVCLRYMIENGALLSGPKGPWAHLRDMTAECRKVLKNTHIYPALVAERIKGLKRRGWVGGYYSDWRITPEGIAALASALGKRHKF